MSETIDRREMERLLAVIREGTAPGCVPLVESEVRQSYAVFRAARRRDGRDASVAAFTEVAKRMTAAVLAGQFGAAERILLEALGMTEAGDAQTE